MSLLGHLSPASAAALLVFPDHVLSYGEIALRVDDLSRRIGGESRLVAIEAAPNADFIVSYLAALSAGHAVALLPPGDAAAMAGFVADFAPALVFAETDGAWRMSEHAAATPSLHPDLAVMLATSGSEGRPRWVRLSRANIEANARSIASYLGLTAADRVAHVLPFHYSYGLSVLHAHLVAGGSIAFCGESVISPGFLDAARQARCTGFSGVPFTYELLERIGFRERLWPELRMMTVAGGRLPPEQALLYHAAMTAHGGRFFVMYGQTEATARMAYVPPERLADHPDSIGIAIPGGSFMLRDEEGREITSPDQQGELVYRGPNVMMGYATTPEDLARGAELSELATGDIAALLPGGFIRLHGRARRFSKIAGLRIGHEAIEWALRAEGIACAVTGDDEAVIVHTEGPCGREVTARAAEAAGIPAGFIRLRSHSSLPRFVSGKIDYGALARQAVPQPAPAPAQGLIDDFRAAFYPRAITAEDSFDSLEGDSLSYVQASLAIETRLGHVPAGWERMPIATLDRMALAKAAPARGGLARIESHILLRAAAILLIVVHHATLWPVPGGAAALMVMVGYGFARFHREQLFEGRTAAFLLPMLRNLVPYAVIVLGFALAWENIPWASVLLIGNLGFADPAQKTMLPFQFWFVEAYAQLCLLMAGAFTIRTVRRTVSHHPFATGIGLLLFAFSLRYTVPLVYDIGGRKLFLLSYVLWLPALGWCACFANTARQKLTLLLATAILCPIAAYTGGNWVGAWILYMLQLAAVAVLLFLPQIGLPRLVIPAVMLVSAASYHIYLFHRIVPELLGLDGLGPLGITASIAIGLISGIGAMALQRLIFARLGPRQRLAARSA